MHAGNSSMAGNTSDYSPTRPAKAVSGQPAPMRRLQAAEIPGEIPSASKAQKTLQSHEFVVPLPG